MKAKKERPIQRVIWIVLDGVGVGASPDASLFGDHQVNTLAHTLQAYYQHTHQHLPLPTLAKLGLGNILPLPGIPPILQTPLPGVVGWGKCQEASAAKDTISGHWEMAGVTLREPFTIYPSGFPEDVLQAWVKASHLPGYLCNKPANGVTVLEDFGEEHLATGKPIVYTSADSVWQIAAHETSFGLERLYAVTQEAIKYRGPLNLGRIIARPFIGTPKAFERTYKRKDFATPPPYPTVLDHISDHGLPVTGIGKIASIYADRGFTHSISTQGNEDGMQRILQIMKFQQHGVIFCNLIDFDMTYGHRRDAVGFAHCLQRFDQALPPILEELQQGNLLLITADHGNDPTAPGSDHTREFVPLIAYLPHTTSHVKSLGTRPTFADMGATVLDALAPHIKPQEGSSFLSALYTN